MARGYGGVLALVVAGCFVDTGGGASATRDAMNEVTGGDAGATSGEPGGSTCAGACGPGETTAAAPTTGEGVTGSTTSEDATTGSVTGGGSGMFVLDTQVSLTGAYAPAAVNFNLDAFADLAVTSRDLSAPNVYVLLGPGGGMPELVNGGAATAIEAADYDGDLDSDLMIARPGAPAQVHTFTWEKGLKGGALIQMPTDCVAPRELGYTDFDGDGALDAALGCDAAGLILLPGGGNGVFGAPIQITVGGAVGAIAVADVGGTPDVDLVFTDTMNDVVVFIAGTGSFMPALDQTATFPVATPTAITLGDVDGSGLLDVAVASGSGMCPIFLSTGAFPVAGDVYPCGADARDIHLPDLDVDGIVDVVTIHGDGLHVGRGLGDGTFSGPDVYPAGPLAEQAAILDFNGDSRLDIAVTSPDTLTVYLQVP